MSVSEIAAPYPLGIANKVRIEESAGNSVLLVSVVEKCRLHAVSRKSPVKSSSGPNSQIVMSEKSFPEYTGPSNLALVTLMRAGVNSYHVQSL